MISDGLIISFIACAILLLISYRYKSLAATFVASVGTLICALLTFQETESTLAMALLMMIAFSSFILIGVGGKS